MIFWAAAAHDGQRIVTGAASNSRSLPLRQNLGWLPEYLTRLAEVCRDELKRDVRDQDEDA